LLLKKKFIISIANYCFRQTETEITLERSKSRPELMKKFWDNGLYGAYIPKADGEFSY